MKISKSTINILNNLSNINPSIWIEEGNIIATKKVIRSSTGTDIPTGTVFAVAEVDDKFEKEFSIYDLKQFLQIANTFDEPDYKFEDKFVTLTEGNLSVKYGYCDKSIIAIPKAKSMPIDSVKAEFIMDRGMFDKLKKMSSILRNEDIVIRNSEDNKIELVLTNLEIKGTDFNIIIDKEVEGNFSYATTISDFTILTDDYNAKLIETNGREALLLEGINNPIKYFIILVSK